MSSKQKLILTLLGLFLIFFTSMIVITVIHFRDFGIKSAEKRAMITAETVKGGLTAHMVNGIMDKRSYFLKQIEDIENVSALWISRSPTVIKQFGDGFNNEITRDEMDKEVMSTGKIAREMTETATKSTMRITIPFSASSRSTPSCLGCHDAKEGEVLGTISMIIDVSDVRGSSLITIVYISILAIIIMLLVLFIVNKFLKPYINVFYSIRDVMTAAYDGDYSMRVDGGNLKESKSVANMLNALLDKLQTVFQEIDKKVHVFLQNKNNIQDSDPLVNISNTIDQLSEIYKFKQTIEHDETLEDIYKRLAYVLQKKFALDDFSFIEADSINKTKKVVYSVNGCHCNIEDGVCRADRINMIVDSTIFDHTCDKYNNPNLEFLCVPYSISNELNLIISFSTKNQEESIRIRSLAGLIEDYITTAQPAIVSKKLMQLLNKMARVDQLTGMYNRKYLDEFAETTIPQALRAGTTYGILMIDVDFFKEINDTYGHDVGDEAIRIVSRVIKESIRKSDIAIRFGGEEFLVLLHNCERTYIEEIAQKIRKSFSKQLIYSGAKSFSKTLSVGTVMFPSDNENIWECLKYADIALYHAKEHGRNQVVCYSNSILNPS